MADNNKFTNKMSRVEDGSRSRERLPNSEKRGKLRLTSDLQGRYTSVETFTSVGGLAFGAFVMSILSEHYIVALVGGIIGEGVGIVVGRSINEVRKRIIAS